MDDLNYEEVSEYLGLVFARTGIVKGIFRLKDWTAQSFLDGIV